MSTVPPLVEKKRLSPPTWGGSILLADIKGRPEIIPDRKHETIASHFKAMLGVLAGWFWFLLIINVLGFCFFFIKSRKTINGVRVWGYHTRGTTTVVGTAFMWWVILFDVIILGWYVLKFVISAFFVILKSVKVLSFAYYLLAPFKNNVNGIVWVVMLTAVFSYILEGPSVPGSAALCPAAPGCVLSDDGVTFRDLKQKPQWYQGPLQKGVSKRIVQVLWAFLISFIILLVKRAIVLAVEISLYHKMEEEVLATQLLQNTLAPLFKSPSKGLQKILDMGPSVDKLLPPGILGLVKLVTVADEIRFEGLHAVDNRLPYGGESKRVPDVLLASEAGHVSREFFDDVAKGDLSINKEKLQQHCKSDSAGAQLFVMIDRENLGELDKAAVERGFVYIFHKRAELQRVLEGRQLLVEVTNELLTAICYFVIFLVFLAAFSLNVSTVMSPNLLVIACLTFIFAPFLRDFIASLHLVFFIRPFDLGDYILVDAGQAPQEELLVKKVRTLVTHCRNAKGEKIYIANAIIAQSKITNLSRLKSGRNAALIKLMPSAVGATKN